MRLQDAVESQIAKSRLARREIVGLPVDKVIENYPFNWKGYSVTKSEKKMLNKAYNYALADGVSRGTAVGIAIDAVLAFTGQHDDVLEAMERIADKKEQDDKDDLDRQYAKKRLMGYWGSLYKGNLSDLQNALNSIFSPELASRFNDARFANGTALLNNPEFVRALHKGLCNQEETTA